MSFSIDWKFGVILWTLDMVRWLTAKINHDRRVPEARMPYRKFRRLLGKVAILAAENELPALANLCNEAVIAAKTHRKKHLPTAQSIKLAEAEFYTYHV